MVGELLTAISAARPRWVREKQRLGVPFVDQLIMQVKVFLHALGPTMLWLFSGLASRDQAKNEQD